MDRDIAEGFEKLIEAANRTNARLDEVVNIMSQGFAGIGQRLDQTNQRIDTLSGRLDTLSGRIDTLSGRMDRLLESHADIRQRLAEHTHEGPH
jgi:hypothetical protein